MPNQLYFFLGLILLFFLGYMFLFLALIHKNLKEMLTINAGIYEKIFFIYEDIRDMKVEVKEVGHQLPYCFADIENIKNDVELFAEQKRKDDREMELKKL